MHASLKIQNHCQIHVLHKYHKYQLLSANIMLWIWGLQDEYSIVRLDYLRQSSVLRSDDFWIYADMLSAASVTKYAPRIWWSFVDADLDIWSQSPWAQPRITPSLVTSVWNSPLFWKSGGLHQVHEPGTASSDITRDVISLETADSTRPRHNWAVLVDSLGAIVIFMTTEQHL